MKHEYKYDVAFSFCMEDSSLAKALNDKLKDRMETFIFFDRQNEIAARDGEETFSSVFGKEARIVVILYRQTWGTTPFTRIEMTAIKNRAFEKGYDFAVLIPTEDKPQVPVWYPKPFIYVGLKNYGIEGTCAVIESKVTEHGGEPKEETLEIKADRLRKKIEFKEKRELILQGESAARLSDTVYESLCLKIEHILLRMELVSPKFKHEKEKNRNSQIFSVHAFSVRLSWNRYYANSLSNSNLEIRFTEGKDSFKDRIFYLGREPRVVKTLEYNLDFGENEEYGWSLKRAGGVFISNETLAESIAEEILILISTEQ